MAASDAKPFARKNVAHRVYFPILDADGDPVAGATGLLGRVSIDGASYTTTTSAPTEIGSTGTFFQDLTAAEMNGDGIILIVSSSSAGAKSTVIVMYPQDNSDIRVNVVEWASSPVQSVAVAGTPKVDVSHWLSTAAATPTVAGVPEVDVTHWIGTAVATPTVAGVPEVDLTHVAGSTTNVSALATNVDAILTDTAEIGVAGAGLTAINLPNQTMDIVGNITGNLSGSVGSVTAKVTANVIEWASSPVASVGVAGIPKVDVTHWISSAAATPTVAGVPEVDLTHVAGSTTNVSTLATNVDAILTDTADMQPKLGTPAGASISADIAAIEAQTDDIGVAGAGLTALATQASVNSLNADVVAIKSKTDSLVFTVANKVDANSTHISGSSESADRLERSTLAIVTGTVGVSSTTTAIIFSSLSPTSAVNDQFKGRIITFDKDTTTAALRGQATDITAYTHATLTATVTALTTAPVSGDTCVIT